MAKKSKEIAKMEDAEDVEIDSSEKLTMVESKHEFVRVDV